MVLSLDPRFPLVWRTPSSVQLGVASPVVVLYDVSSAVEHMLAALSGGVTRPGLELIAREAGATTGAVATLLDELGPALLPSRPASAFGQQVEKHPHRKAHAQSVPGMRQERRVPAVLHELPVPPTVLLAGNGPFIDRLALVLSTEGVATSLARDADAETAAAAHCDLAIVSSHFVLAPELHGVWLRRDIPHLSVVFLDSAVRVGPLVEPGMGPCLYCLERHATDADAAWPAIAAQLWGRRSRLETALNAGEVAHFVARLVLEHVRRGSTENPGDYARGHAASTTHTFEPTTGSWSRSQAAPHPECGCVALNVPARD
ncbi:MAG: hypothetical protein ACOH1J_02695 [Microbacteriaceae bacterium]